MQSVISMVKQARSNAKLYEEMLAAGYTDGEFPAWWFSPARDGQTPAQTPAQTEPAADGTLKQAQLAEDGSARQGEQGYDPTPPQKPASREGGLGRPTPAEPSRTQPSSATLS